MKMPFGYVPHKSSWKDAILKILGHTSMIRRIQAAVIMKMLNPQKDNLILDAGCCGGFFSYEIAKICRCIGVDWNINANISYARYKLSSVAYMKADVQKMPFKDKVFDKILLSSTLQMVEDDGTLLKECCRILQEDGTLVLSVPEEYIYIKKLNKLKGMLNKKFGANKGYYKQSEIIELLQRKKFQIMEIEHAPKRVGSLLYELQLFLWYHNLPLFHVFFFPLFYPIGLLDRLDNKNAKGCELIISAKVNKGIG